MLRAKERFVVYFDHQTYKLEETVFENFLSFMFFFKKEGKLQETMIMTSKWHAEYHQNTQQRENMFCLGYVLQTCF